MASVLRTGESKEAFYVPTRLPLCRGKVKDRTLTGVEPCEGDSRVVREPVVASQRANDTDDFYFVTLVPCSVGVNEDSRDVRVRKHPEKQNARRKINN